MAEEALSTIRSEPRRRAVGYAVATLLGLGLAALHWLGLVVGGLAVALVAPTARRGVVAGIAFGVVAWLGFLGVLATSGDAGAVLGMGVVPWLAAAIGVLCGGLGGLGRAIV